MEFVLYWKRALSKLLRRLSIGVVAFSLSATVAEAQSVIIEINDSSSNPEGYLCWTPVRAQAKLAVDTVASTAGYATKRVTLTSEGETGGGAVQFQEALGVRPTRYTFAPQSRVDLNLLSDGSWAPFWVAGTRASQGTKDVSIVARGEDGTILGSFSVMVRVRKDADKLTSFETQIFLNALSKLHDVDNGSVNSGYTPFTRIHEAANQLQIHKSPLFLPWHRAFVLDLERRLQAIDARVTVPYWRFDRVAKNVFSADFMGVTEPAVPFSPGPGLARWIDPRLGKLNRDPVKAPADGLLDGSITALFNDTYVIFRGQLESQFHTGAHKQVGGWLGGPASPADPLFFLLHANVDRIWAHWQVKHGRFNPNDELSYSSQGKYPGAGPDAGVYAPGVYAEDEMWPWSNFSPTGLSVSPWPTIDHAMPSGGQASSILSSITPGGMIDYLDVGGKGLALGYCYDDIDFFGQMISASP